MARSNKRRSRKIGLPPGTPIHIGERKTERVTITITYYDETSLKERVISSVNDIPDLSKSTGVTWINVEGLHEPETLEAIGQRIGLHPLTIEDILNTDQRPKLDVFDDYLFIVVKVLLHDETTSILDIDQLSIIVGAKWVVTFGEKKVTIFDPCKQRLDSDKSRMRRQGADYLAYSLLDAVVDHYFLVLERLGEEIEFLQERLVSSPGPETLRQVQHLRFEMINVRKSIWPLREVVNELQRQETPLITETTSIYLRDVYDHVIQVMDTVETYREMVSEMLDIYLSSISNKTNEVMKVLTIIATIFIPLTFIVGLYGMNFEFMPELSSPYGYPSVLVFMTLIGISMVIYFRRRGWI